MTVIIPGIGLDHQRVPIQPQNVSLINIVYNFVKFFSLTALIDFFVRFFPSTVFLLLKINNVINSTCYSKKRKENNQNTFLLQS